MQINQKEFEEAMKPAIAWLNKNTDAHCKIIIDYTGAELVSGENAFNTDEYLVD